MSELAGVRSVEDACGGDGSVACIHRVHTRPAAHVMCDSDDSEHQPHMCMQSSMHRQLCYELIFSVSCASALKHILYTLSRAALACKVSRGDRV